MRFGTLPEVEGTHVYRLKVLKESSAKLGPCEVCGEWCPQVAYQVEGCTYREGNGTMQITFLGCSNLFGHETCLIGTRRVKQSHSNGNVFGAHENGNH